MWPKSLIPDKNFVCNEFVLLRCLTLVLSLLQNVRGALTATTLLFAIGVGDANASPLAYLLITEANALASRLLGLALSSVCSAAVFAEHARVVLTANIFLSLVSCLFPILLMRSPDSLAVLSMAEAVFNTAKALALTA